MERISHKEQEAMEKARQSYDMRLSKIFNPNFVPESQTRKRVKTATARKSYTQFDSRGNQPYESKVMTPVTVEKTVDIVDLRSTFVEKIVTRMSQKFGQDKETKHKIKNIVAQHLPLGQERLKVSDFDKMEQKIALVTSPTSEYKGKQQGLSAENFQPLLAQNFQATQVTTPTLRTRVISPTNMVKSPLGSKFLTAAIGEMDTVVRKKTLGVLKQQILQNISKFNDPSKSKKANTLWTHISNFKEQAKQNFEQQRIEKQESEKLKIKQNLEAQIAFKQNEISLSKVQVLKDRNQVDRVFRTYQESIQKQQQEALLLKTQKMAEFKEAIARSQQQSPKTVYRQITETPPMIKEMAKREDLATHFTRDQQLKTSVNHLKEIYARKIQQRTDKEQDNKMVLELDPICRLQEKSRQELSKQLEVIRLKASRRLVSATCRNGQFLLKSCDWRETQKQDELMAKELQRQKNLEDDQARESYQAYLRQEKRAMVTTNANIAIQKKEFKGPTAQKTGIYATITGPNYGGCYQVNQNKAEQLTEQIQRNKALLSSKEFFGMNDDELLCNVPVLKEMGLIK